MLVLDVHWLGLCCVSRLRIVQSNGNLLRVLRRVAQNYLSQRSEGTKECHSQASLCLVPMPWQESRAPVLPAVRRRSSVWERLGMQNKSNCKMAYGLEILGIVVAICSRLFGVWACDKTDVCLCIAVPVVVEANMGRKEGNIQCVSGTSQVSIAQKWLLTWCSGFLYVLWSAMV